jgi:hypothetical protein
MRFAILNRMSTPKRRLLLNRLTVRQLGEVTGGLEIATVTGSLVKGTGSLVPRDPTGERAITRGGNGCPTIPTANFCNP